MESFHGGQSFTLLQTTYGAPFFAWLSLFSSSREASDFIFIDLVRAKDGDCFLMRDMDVVED